MKKKLKFILNYSRDKRDINTIATDFEDSIYDFHTCFSFVTLVNGEEVPPLKILDMKLIDVIKNDYQFRARRFNCSNLKKGDYGVLKETSNNVTRYYLIKILEIDDFINFQDLSDETIAEYISFNIPNRKNYVAKYINFYTDKDYLLDDNNFISSDITFEKFKETYKNVNNTLFQPKDKITIEWNDK